MGYNLEVGKFYFLKINHHGRNLDYEGKLIDLDKKEFAIKTEEDCRIEFKLKDLVYSKEIPAIELDEDKVFVIRKRVKKEELREPDRPEGL